MTALTRCVICPLIASESEQRFFHKYDEKQRSGKSLGNEGAWLESKSITRVVFSVFNYFVALAEFRETKIE